MFYDNFVCIKLIIVLSLTSAKDVLISNIQDNTIGGRSSIIWSLVSSLVSVSARFGSVMCVYLIDSSSNISRKVSFDCLFGEDILIGLIVSIIDVKLSVV